MRVPCRLRSLTVPVWVGVFGALPLPQLVYAELVATPGQMLPDSGQESPKWMPHNDDLSVDVNALKTGAAPVFMDQTTTTPSSQRLPAAPALSTSPGLSQASNPAARSPAARDDPSWEQELKSHIKNAVRPVYDEAVDSGVVGAIHDIQAGLGLNHNPSLKETHWEGHPQTSDKAAPPGTPQWETQGGGGGPQEPVRTAAQIERDNLLASDLLNQLLDDIKPWAGGMLALYVLTYMVKGVRTYMRAKATRRIKKQTRRALHRHHR